MMQTERIAIYDKNYFTSDDFKPTYHLHITTYISPPKIPNVSGENFIRSLCIKGIWKSIITWISNHISISALSNEVKMGVEST